MPSTRTAILSATDYYPFGMAIKSRSSVMPSEKYAFGFGGQQISDEINANSYTAQFWQYDARIGRRLNLDPVDQFSISNYAAFRNNPIAFVDPLGNTAIEEKNLKLGDGKSETEMTIVEDGKSGLDYSYKDEVSGESKQYHIDDAVCVYKPKEKAPAGSTYTESYARKASRLFKPLDYDKYGGDGEDWISGGGFGVDGSVGIGIYTFGIKLETMSTTEYDAGYELDIFYDVRMGAELKGKDGKSSWSNTFSGFKPSASVKVYMYGNAPSIAYGNLKVSNNVDIYNQNEAALGPIVIGVNSKGKVIFGWGVSTSKKDSYCKSDIRIRTTLFHEVKEPVDLRGGY